MIRLDGDDFLIDHYPGDRELKAVGARWNKKADAWRLPASAMNRIVLHELDLEGIPDALPLPLMAFDDDRLFDYQLDAVSRLVAAKHGMLLALSPGLGKTAVSIKAADFTVTPKDRIVVVAPASLLPTWRREIEKWSDDPRTYILEGQLDFDKAMDTRWIILSWDKMARDKIDWGNGWPLWILDESVLVKSRTSKRYKTLSKLRRSIETVWHLSGSPMTRFTDDLWSQFNLLWPNAFPSYWRFTERYCTVEDTPWARSVTGNRRTMDVARDNEDIMLVVNQEEVLDLPEYLFEPPIEVTLTKPQQAHYDEMTSTFITDLHGEEVVAVNEAVKMMQLQRIASQWDGHSAKLDTLVQVIQNYPAPYLIWTHWKETAKAVGEALNDMGIETATVTGDSGNKELSLQRFKDGMYEALVLSLGVGKFGHTFTNVKTIISFDRNFNADDYFQSMHRVRRIGLKHSPIVLPFVAAGTVDELTLGDNLEAKLAGIAKLTRADLASLLKGLGR